MMWFEIQIFQNDPSDKEQGNEGLAYSTESKKERRERENSVRST